MTKRILAISISTLLSSPWLPVQSAPLGKTFKRVRASVVVILTEEKTLPLNAYEGKPVSVEGLGSGALISDDGRVLTAAHVVQTADRVQVEFPNGETVKAQVIASEPPAR